MSTYAAILVLQKVEILNRKIHLLTHYSSDTGVHVMVLGGSAMAVSLCHRSHLSLFACVFRSPVYRE